MTSPAISDPKQDRRSFLGSTDVAAIMGKHPYRSALDVYLEKVALEPPEPLTMPVLGLGLALEPYVALRYEQETGRETYLGPDRYVSDRRPYLRAQVDRLVVDRGGLELKTSDYVPFTRMLREGLPEHYIIQGQFAAAIAGFDHYDWAVLCRGDGALFVFEQDTDQIMGKQLIAEAIHFWEEHVLPRIPPEPIKPADVDPFPKDATATALTDEQEALVLQLHTAKVLSRDATTMEQAAKARLALALGDAWGNYQSENVHLRWAQQKGRVTVDAKALETAMPLDTIATLAWFTLRADSTGLLHVDWMEAATDLVAQCRLDFEPFRKYGEPFLAPRITVRETPDV